MNKDTRSVWTRADAVVKLARERGRYVKRDVARFAVLRRALFPLTHMLDEPCYGEWLMDRRKGEAASTRLLRIVREYGISNGI